MESSLANRLPEADSLPDGFVEVSADLSPSPLPPPSDYKEAFVDLQPSVEQLVDPYPPPSGSGAETLPPDPLGNGSERYVTSADLLTKGDCPDSSGRGEILESKPGDEASESSIPKDEVLLGTATEGNSQRDSKSSETETKGMMELHPTNLKESSETKRKIVKRNAKSDKELLEFTLKYQKVVAERDAGLNN
ncbi:uncharacterized protein LOC121976861 isoform X2 [Zingiber officinale]|uniref:Uncharacterized protein n=1 Tax=Zingiber officinale TaxID=94328 RepID=A0A8J5LI75_ZINOF|nr:uncharacterized protein LOC121976861 isoform X2 [Zingiber officinale]KAG6512653.1 hypothetical protein ZIOFF_030782 [Zingiber officinale]